jgi:hypothetical protein
MAVVPHRLFGILATSQGVSIAAKVPNEHISSHRSVDAET